MRNRVLKSEGGVEEALKRGCALAAVITLTFMRASLFFNHLIGTASRAFLSVSGQAPISTLDSKFSMKGSALLK